MAKYKLIFNDDRVSEVVEKAFVDEENRVVKQEPKNAQNVNRDYNYYPFENLTAIIYLGED